jgi:DinB family protein
MTDEILIVLEAGSKRVFASALDWPGWARSGRDEAAALDALLAYTGRYERAVGSTSPGFHGPSDATTLVVAERLPGDATTDYGAPGAPAEAESAPMDAATLERLQTLFSACWRYFAEVAGSSADKELRKGPRGGGRSVERIVEHVTEAHRGYLRQIFWRQPIEKPQDVSAHIDVLIEADARALAYAASGEMPERGARGGKLWTPRYFVRRAAWHILDHAWEIEDRLEP